MPWWSVGVIGAVLLSAIFAPILAPHDPGTISLRNARIPPLTDPSYPLGSDLLGRDMLSRLIFGARGSMAVAVSSLLVAVTVGSSVGLTAGYLGGRIDRLLMRITDAAMGFPAILTAMLVVVILGKGLTNVVLAIALTTWPGFARMMRGEVLRYRESDFVLFARVVGTKARVILGRHIFPNVLGTLVVVATLTLAEVVLLEASLSFLGLGFAPGAPAWGIMVAEGRQVLRQAWWLSVIPGVTITLVVVAVSFFGDWLGDVLDPNRRPFVVPGVELTALKD